MINSFIGLFYPHTLHKSYYWPDLEIVGILGLLWQNLIWAIERKILTERNWHEIKKKVCACAFAEHLGKQKNKTKKRRDRSRSCDMLWLYSLRRKNQGIVPRLVILNVRPAYIKTCSAEFHAAENKRLPLAHVHRKNYGKWKNKWSYAGTSGRVAREPWDKWCRSLLDVVSNGSSRRNKWNFCSSLGVWEMLSLSMQP